MDKKLHVLSVRSSFQTFSWIDYSVFVLMLIVCGGIGVYFGFVKKNKSTQDYLMGGRNMELVPVCFSLVASFISGISLLGIPTELYIFGTSYVFMIIGALFMSIIIVKTFIPVLHELQLTSAYEGALAGGVVGSAIMSWWCLSAQLAIANGHIVHPHKPFTTEGCTYNYTMDLPSNIERTEVSPILHVSYMWYTLAGALITITVGLVVSKINSLRGKAYVPPPNKLLAPQLRRLYREPPHPTDELYIRAYGTNKVSTQENSTSIPMKTIKHAEGVS